MAEHGVGERDDVLFGDMGPGIPESERLAGKDEALSSPTERSAQLAINTQNILRDEAGLTEVIDPLGGSYYVEKLTNDLATFKFFNQ